MIKRLSVALLLPLLFCAHMWAQEAGQMQVSVVLGSNTMFNQNTSSYLLPKYNHADAAPGTGIGNADPTTNAQSNDPGVFLNLGEIGNNSIVNMTGVQFRYFLSSKLDVNMMFAMNIASTPKRDFVEGDQTIPDMAIPQQRFIEGRLSNNWMANVGSNYHFSTSNNRINLYGGVLLGFQMGRIQTTTPYTGNDEYHIYNPSGKAGQLWAAQGSIVGGVECEVASGLVLGIEFAPVAYQYSVFEIYPKGFDVYTADHHNFKLFSSPNVKLGFRF